MVHSQLLIQVIARKTVILVRDGNKRNFSLILSLPLCSHYLFMEKKKKQLVLGKKKETALLPSVLLANSLTHHSHLQIPISYCTSWASGFLPVPLVLSLRGKTQHRRAGHYMYPKQKARVTSEGAKSSLTSILDF